MKSSEVNSIVMRTIRYNNTVLKRLPLCPQCGQEPTVIMRQTTETISFELFLSQKTIQRTPPTDEIIFIARWFVRCSTADCMGSNGRYVLQLKDACNDWANWVRNYYGNHATVHELALQHNMCIETSNEPIVYRKKTPFWDEMPKEWKWRGFDGVVEQEQSTRIILFDDEINEKKQDK